jgi:urease accessory protein
MSYSVSNDKGRSYRRKLLLDLQANSFSPSQSHCHNRPESLLLLISYRIMSLSRAVKKGIGRLTASADTKKTRLTQVSHKAPTRLIPLGKSSVEMAGAAICALSNYGGGMLQGDSSDLFINVEKKARLGVITQGASRIYSQRIPNECQATLHATVEKDGVLVYAPDPCSLFAASSFAQKQEFHIHPQSSVVLIDWFSSGRYRNGEHWAFDKLSSRTSLSWLGEANPPFLQDSVSMDLRIRQTNESDLDPLGVYNFHAFASLILYGKETEAIQRKCEILQDGLAAESTRIRERSETAHVDPKQLRLAGQVCMGLSRVELPDKEYDAHVVRLAATTNEDLYRVFHHCLLPVGESFGMEFYKDRIRAKESEIPAMHANASTNGASSRPSKYPSREDPTSPLWSAGMANEGGNAFWSAYMLADSCMPTGSFAHSSGLEAAAQLGIVKNEDELKTFIQATTRSTMQVMTPFLIAGHRLALETVSDHEATAEKWKELDKQMQAILASNAPACAASADQGKSLLRVAKQWLGEESAGNLRALSFDQCSHVAPILGAVSAMLGLDESQVCHMFGYCVARDIVSAAVRLSMVGPLASVRLLHQVQGAAENGYNASLLAMEEHSEEGPLVAAAGSAPIVEAIHPCHDILKLRLFRS